MIKILCIILVILVSSFLGYLLSQRYVKRAKFFNSLVMLSDKLEVDINFSREKLSSLISSYDNGYSKDLMGIKENYLDYLNQKVELTEVTLFKKNALLKPEEKNLIFLFFKCLGRLDVYNQTKEIDNFKQRFKSIQETVNVERKKYGSLFLKLGFVLGVFLALLII